jgi:hypothetical protein
MNNYDPANWYWKADDGRIFASARQIIVPDTDADYLVFIQRVAPTMWPRDTAGDQTDAALQEVLTPFNIFVTLQGRAQALAKRARRHHAVVGYADQDRRPFAGQDHRSVFGCGGAANSCHAVGCG